MKIVVNGLARETAASSLGYHHILYHAGYHTGARLESALTVTYRGKMMHGTLCPSDEPVALEEGMVFNVAHTGSA